MSPVLELVDLSAGYGGPAVLHQVCLQVDAGEIVVLLGSNGAGKTTTLRAVSGMIAGTGTVRLDGTDLGRRRPDQRARLGLGHVPEGRGTLAQLTVEENLWVATARLSAAERSSRLDHWYGLFPKLSERRHQVAGSLSGGEQQLLAIARALVTRPSVLLLDEPSLGLAPLMITEVFTQLLQLGSELGTALLVVEQNAVAALSIAHRGYVLESGTIVREGTAADLQGDDSIRRAYLGV